METVRAARVAAALVILALPLTACESVAQGPAAVSRSGSQLNVAVCTDIDVARIVGEVNRGAEYLKFLDVKGAATLSSGTFFPLDEPPTGLTGTARSFDFADGGTVILSLQGPVDSFNAGFRAEEIQEGDWLHPDGSLTTLPCE